MSVESAITDLTNTTNALNTTLSTSITNISNRVTPIEAKLLATNVTLQVGAGKQFTTLQAAFDYISNNVPTGAVNIPANLSG